MTVLKRGDETAVPKGNAGSRLEEHSPSVRVGASCQVWRGPGGLGTERKDLGVSSENQSTHSCVVT